MPTPQRRIVRGCARLHLIEHAVRNADVGDAHLSGVQPSGQQQMSRLAAEERDAFARPHGRAHHRTACAIDTTRQVDRDDGRAARVHRFDQRARCAVGHAIQSGAEQRVDDDAGARNPLGRRRLDRASPSLRGFGCVTLQCRGVAEQHEPHRIATLGKDARRHEPVATIVARSRHHHDPRAEWAARHRVGDRPARLFHQRDAGHAGCDREPVARRHFVGSQKLDHRVRLVRQDSAERRRENARKSSIGCGLQPSPAKWADCLFFHQKLEATLGTQPSRRAELAQNKRLSSGPPPWHGPC